MAGVVLPLAATVKIGTPDKRLRGTFVEARAERKYILCSSPETLLLLLLVLRFTGGGGDLGSPFIMVCRFSLDV